MGCSFLQLPPGAPRAVAMNIGTSALRDVMMWFSRPVFDMGLLLDFASGFFKHLGAYHIPSQDEVLKAARGVRSELLRLT